MKVGNTPDPVQQQSQARTVPSTQQPKKKTHKGRYIGAAILSVLLTVGVVCGGMFVLPYFYESPGDVKTGTEITVTIPEGSSVSEIGQILKDSGVISRSNDFVDKVKELDCATSLKPGTYKFTGGTDIAELVKMIESGKTGYTLLINEGNTAKEVAQKVSTTCEDISYDDFYKLTLNASAYANDYPFLRNVYNNSMEGYLFPSTYNIPFGSNADQVIRMMLDKFAEEFQKVDRNWMQSQNKSIADIVTMASIVEHEAGAYMVESPKIARVFYNRLEQNMALGSDITTYYAVGKSFTDQLTQQDLDSTNPYNTRNPYSRGLPPGPVCNPGLTALQAAANPADGTYTYFFFSERANQIMYFDTLDAFNNAWAEFGTP